MLLLPIWHKMNGNDVYPKVVFLNIATFKTHSRTICSSRNALELKMPYLGNFKITIWSNLFFHIQTFPFTIYSKFNGSLTVKRFLGHTVQNELPRQLHSRYTVWRFSSGCPRRGRWEPAELRVWRTGRWSRPRCPSWPRWSGSLSPSGKTPESQKNTQSSNFPQNTLKFII